MKKFDVFELKNGVRGVLVDLPHLNSVTVEVFVKIGAKYETKDEFGISHVLEHMAFKGTKKRNAIEIHREIDSKGAIHDAGTGFECTSYYISTVEKNILWSLEFLSDILINSTFPKKELKKELGVVVEEIKMYKDNPVMGLSFDLIEFLYGESKSGCWSISGSIEDVLRVDRDKLLAYRKKCLNAKDVVVVVAGKIGNKNDIKKCIKRYFSDLNSLDVDDGKLELILSKKKELIKKKKVDQIHFCLGIPTISNRDKRRYVAKLVEVMLCGNTSSRVFEQVRQKNGLAYYVFPVSEMLKEGGFMGVQIGVNLAKFDKALFLTKREYLEFAKTVSEFELNRAKDCLLGKSEMSLDKTSFWSDFVGRKLLLENKLVSLENELKKYKKVSLKEVKEFAKEFFRKDAFRLVVAKS